MSQERPSPLQQIGADARDALDDATWLDVIHKMDEVYSKLVSDEIELEEKNAQLEESQRFIISLLSAMNDVLIACNQDGVIEETNAALCALVGRSEAALRESQRKVDELQQKLDALLAIDRDTRRRPKTSAK